MNSINFNNRYYKLGKSFFAENNPTPVANPELIKFNENLAITLGMKLDELSPADYAAIFSGNKLLSGTQPLAMAYAGHQFGHFNPQLGDGRAILLGEIISPDGKSFDLQLKGSGQTYYSRNGDGRAALGPVIREYLLSEAMTKLGVPTTRALAAATTGEQVAREQLLPGGIITRIASSFIRVGSFEYFSAKGDVPSIKKLADYVIERNYPKASDSNNRYQSLLKNIVERQAKLIALWMKYGFIHGVMNTDNMSVAGETIDYGPCAFMDAFNPDQVFSSIDRDGRYAYNNQPSIGLWNLTRLAETLLPLFAEDTDTAVEIAKDILKTFVETYQQSWLTGMREKCGLLVPEIEPDQNTLNKDKELIERLFEIMAENNADFTLTFFHLTQLVTQADNRVADEISDSGTNNLFNNSQAFENWLDEWRKRLTEDIQTEKQQQAAMQAVNPIYIPRNHQVESAIRAAEDHNDFSLFHDLHEVLQTPFQYQPEKSEYLQAPKPGEEVLQTFCGT